MRLSVSLLLVTLTLGFFEANAVPCPELLKECTEFIIAPEELYKVELSKFNAPPEAVEARLEVKECVDRISWITKAQLIKIMDTRISAATWKGFNVLP
ncbi:secretoglobin family 1D member-like [Marmota flaviventris]|uniref:secretoglobin family 1D member-like n=1 Tax=Marmota flaviventris TaxID=93162 RepID=UPI000FFF694A|nr:secretoglobin family 1D member-like [Marmota flaviventris]